MGRTWLTGCENDMLTSWGTEKSSCEFLLDLLSVLWIDLLMVVEVPTILCREPDEAKVSRPDLKTRGEVNLTL